VELTQYIAFLGSNILALPGKLVAKLVCPWKLRALHRCKGGNKRFFDIVVLDKTRPPLRRPSSVRFLHFLLDHLLVFSITEQEVPAAKGQYRKWQCK
jgi:hypothetical protein